MCGAPTVAPCACAALSRCAHALCRAAVSIAAGINRESAARGRACRAAECCPVARPPWACRRWRRTSPRSTRSRGAWARGWVPCGAGAAGRRGLRLRGLRLRPAGPCRRPLTWAVFSAGGLRVYIPEKKWSLKYLLYLIEKKIINRSLITSCDFLWLFHNWVSEEGVTLQHVKLKIPLKSPSGFFSCNLLEISHTKHWPRAYTWFIVKWICVSKYVLFVPAKFCRIYCNSITSRLCRIK